MFAPVCTWSLNYIICIFIRYVRYVYQLDALGERTLWTELPCINEEVAADVIFVEATNGN